MTSDLDKLIEAVEGGCLKRLSAHNVKQAIGLHGFAYLHSIVHHGSLDAAKALHEALLPGWEARPIYNCGTDGYAHCTLERTDDCEEVEVHNLKCPARAWLLAILKAYRAQVSAK